MKLGVVILIFLSTFTVRNDYYIQHGYFTEKNNEPGDGRAGESPATSHNHVVCRFAATHPSVLKFKTNVMRNDTQQPDSWSQALCDFNEYRYYRDLYSRPERKLIRRDFRQRSYNLSNHMEL